MSKPRDRLHDDIIKAREEFVRFELKWMKKHKLTEIELLSFFHEEMEYSIKHIREACR
jgi:hypothetical protein